MTDGYVPPSITELGSLKELTQGALDTGGNDFLYVTAIDKSVNADLGTEQISY